MDVCSCQVPKGRLNSVVITPFEMKLSEIKHILEQNQIQLTKSLGQNFLHDSNQLRKIIEAAELTKTDKILEIGPGLGPLTELLLEHSGEILAIEKDARLVKVLSSRLNTPHLRLIHDDALDFLKRESRDWSAWKLVANLPYSVASPILVELAQCPNPPERMVVTLQFEVAKRLMAQCGDPDYGILTLLIQMHYEPQSFHKIPASCFFPAPDVDSAFVSLVRRKSPLLDRSLSPTFSKLVKLAFSQRRKMMLKVLKSNWPLDRLQSAFSELAISPQARAETISLHQFAQLTKLLSQ